jgi:hypothetical protein
MHRPFYLRERPSPPFPIECLGGLVTQTFWTFGTRDKDLFGIKTPHCTACSPVAITIVKAITKIGQYSRHSCNREREFKPSYKNYSMKCDYSYMKHHPTTP